jgi:lipopolysaccharide assembly protein B
MDILLWLLLPVAVWSGWLLAIRIRGPRTNSARNALRPEYFSGINHLLNEQPDKAIEAFIRVLEVDAETVETHLSLGNLYRRRGEVDRAIRVHQNLISSATDHEQRTEAMLELGQDYLSAGLLDRAEDLFLELLESMTYRVQALRQLIDIYEQEKDWTKAVNAARQLEELTGTDLGSVIAHYWCEVAEAELHAGAQDDALEHVRQALDTHADCARASILEGDVLRSLEQYGLAIEAYRRVEAQDPDYLPEVVGRLRECAASLGHVNEIITYLEHVMSRYGGITATLSLSELLEAQAGGERAKVFMTEQLQKRPTVRGFRRLMELEITHGEPANMPRQEVLRDLAVQLLADSPVYKCSHCGFPARALHWQCPGCKHWNSIKPIHGVEGE